MNYTVLIVEDEQRLREVLCDYFKSRGDHPLEAANGEEALAIARKHSLDAVLLDVMMPGLDGFGVCRALRHEAELPILFLTALSDEEDKLRGYELGADDYITKPFSLSVLYAKLVALIRRDRGNIRAGDRLTAGNIALVPSAHKVYAGKREVALTPKEFRRRTRQHLSRRVKVQPF